METKICTKCKKEFPKTNKYFYFRPDSLKYRNTCNLCEKIRLDISYNINKEKIAKRIKERNKLEFVKIEKRERERNYYSNNKEKILLIKQTYRKTYIKPEKTLISIKKRNKILVATLPDCYLKNILPKEIKNIIKKDDLNLIIEAKRQNIILKRKIKNNEQSQICN